MPDAAEGGSAPRDMSGRTVLEGVYARFLATTVPLREQGMEPRLAAAIAVVAENVRQWPADWGQELRVFVYGDFDPPNVELSYPGIGITISPEMRTDTPVRGALTVLEARVSVIGRTLEGLVDALRRVNALLGVLTLYERGGGSFGWWCQITHGPAAREKTRLTHGGVSDSIGALLNLRVDVRQKVEAALFWIREPHRLLLEAYRHDVFRVYSAYWNAFECLVDAVLIVNPHESVGKREKEREIEEFVRAREGKLTAGDVENCYRTIVNKGFVGKAEHALSVCFLERGSEYSTECFRRTDRVNNLYEIRNDINHGDIDAENPSELWRVQMRLRALMRIVWGMFGYLIPCPVLREKVGRE